MYFVLDQARRIDAIRERLHEWHGAGALSDDEFYLLLAALLEDLRCQCSYEDQRNSTGPNRFSCQFDVHDDSVHE